MYIEDSTSVPEYYREVVMSAYQTWQRASEGLVRFEFVENASDADMKCYFNFNDNKDFVTGSVIDIIMKTDFVDSLYDFYTLGITIFILEKYIAKLLT